MASENFIYQPTTGSGNGTITVTANSNNANGTDRTATLTITNGAASKNVTIKQKYRPYFTQNAGSTFPATGGSLNYTVHTEYDVVFRSVPTWIAISQNGTAIAEGQRLTPAEADNKTFTFTAEANTGESRSVGTTFNMGHYLSTGLCRDVSYFSLSQEGAKPTKKMSLSPILIQATSAQTTASLTLTVENCTFDHMTTSTAGTFAITAANPVNNTIQITFPANTAFTSNRGYLSFYLYDTDGDAHTATITVERAACGGITTDVDNILFEYNETSAKTLNVLTGGEWNSSITDNQ